MTIRRGLAAAILATFLVACGGGGGSSGNAPAATSGSPTPAPNPAPAPSPDPEPTPGDDGPTIAKYEPEFEDLFSLEKMHTITIGISTSEWNALLNDFDAHPRNEIFRKADFWYGDAPGDGEFVPNVGFRLRGNLFTRQRPEIGAGAHARSNPLRRVHFRIRFNEQFKDAEDVYGSPEIATHLENKNREFRTVRSLNLKYNKNDPSYTREVLSYDLFRRFGVQTLRQAYTRLYIKIGSAAPRYMGVYLMGEHIDKSWAQRRFGKNAFVFKSLYQGFGPADLANADMDHSIASGAIGSEITDPAAYDRGFSAYRPAYDLKTRKTRFDEAERRLNELIELLTGNPTQQMLEDAIDIPALLRAQAVNVFLGNWDDYWRNGNNYYLVLDPGTDKWLFVPYDYDIVLFDSIWMFDGIATAPFLSWGDDRLSGRPVLMEKVLRFFDFRQLYAGYLRELLDDDDGPANLESIMTAVATQQALVAPYARGYDAVDGIPFSLDVGDIHDYVERRIATARRELGF